MSRYCREAFNRLQPDLFYLVVEHVNQEVQSNHGELLVPNGKFCERFHTRRPHGQALVLQTVDESPARAQGHQVDLEEERFQGRVQSK